MLIKKDRSQTTNEVQKSPTQNIKSEKEILSEIEQSLRKKEKNIIEVPNGITTISKGIFNNTDIEEVILPESLISIEDETFAYCTELRKVTIKSKKLEKIGNYVFHNTINLESINLPDSISIIGQYAFSGSGIESIKIPNYIKTIQSHAFFEFKKLHSVEKMENIIKL